MKLTRPNTSESEIEAYLNECVTAIGGETRKVSWVMRSGAPDRLVMFPEGWLYWVELKAPGKIPEPHQIREHNRMRNLDQLVVVIDSFEAVERLCAPHKPV